MHDPRIGRFFAVDPLTHYYPHNSPYAFSENVVINAIELEGLEKLTINGNGTGGSYSENHNATFKRRAKRLEKYGYRQQSVSTGLDILNALEEETQLAGSISRVVVFSHGGYLGLFINEDNGFYTTGTTFGGKDERNVNDLGKKIADGSIKFDDDALIIFGSCNANFNGGMEGDIAYDITFNHGISTIGASGYVEPEILDGKSTGRLTTTGTFYKLEKIVDYSVSFLQKEKKPLLIHSKQKKKLMISIRLH